MVIKKHFCNHVHPNKEKKNTPIRVFKVAQNILNPNFRSCYVYLAYPQHQQWHHAKKTLHNNTIDILNNLVPLHA